MHIFFDFEVIWVKLILIDLHFIQFSLKWYFLFSNRLIWKIEAFDDISYVLLAVFGHIDHFVKKSVYSFFVLFEYICYSDHPTTAVE